MTVYTAICERPYGYVGIASSLKRIVWTICKAHPHAVKIDDSTYSDGNTTINIITDNICHSNSPTYYRVKGHCELPMDRWRTWDNIVDVIYPRVLGSQTLDIALKLYSKKGSSDDVCLRWILENLSRRT